MSGAARQTMHARRHFAPWRPDEDLAVLGAQPGQFRAVAVQLGRTHTAVVRRRRELHRRRREKAMSKPTETVRFTAVQPAGEWTVWDSKDGRRIKPAGKWGREAAEEIARSLNARPYQADVWQWVPYWPI